MRPRYDIFPVLQYPDSANLGLSTPLPSLSHHIYNQTINIGFGATGRIAEPSETTTGKPLLHSQSTQIKICASARGARAMRS